MNYEESLDKLFSLHQFGVKLGLENITNLLEHIGNPQKKIRTIHIAGSNGKGSTSSFIASVLKEEGFKVGLYTSPHFVLFNERIRINGVTIPNDYIVNFINKNINYINSESPTFFELTTALAFQYFSEEEIDYAIIETGLGGRLDATNILDSTASVITSISLEHTNILGDNIAAIAKEKGGIVKENQKVFVGLMVEEARGAINKICSERKSQMIDILDFMQVKDSSVEINFGKEKLTINKLPLSGKYQLYNAALASLVVKEIFPNITNQIIEIGFENVIANTGIQGRYEIYSKTPNVIFDAAHNLEGINVFLNEYKNGYSKYKKKILIYGAMKDKNVEEIILQLNKSFDIIYGVEINYERSLSILELIEIGKNVGVKIVPLKVPHEFIKEFILNGENNSLVVLGSIYILGEIKKKLIEK